MTNNNDRKIEYEEYYNKSPGYYSFKKNKLYNSNKYDKMTNQTFSKVNLKQKIVNFDNSVNSRINTVEDIANCLEYDKLELNKALFLKNRDKSKMNPPKINRSSTKERAFQKGIYENNQLIINLLEQVGNSSKNNLRKITRDGVLLTNVYSPNLSPKNRLSPTHSTKKNKKLLLDEFSLENNMMDGVNQEVGIRTSKETKTDMKKLNLVSFKDELQSVEHNLFLPQIKLSPVSVRQPLDYILSTRDSVIEQKKKLDDVLHQIENCNKEVHATILDNTAKIKSTRRSIDRIIKEKKNSLIENDQDDEINKIKREHKLESVFLYQLNKMVNVNDIADIKHIESIKLKKKKEQLLKLDNNGAYKFRKVLAEKYHMDLKDFDGIKGNFDYTKLMRRKNHDHVENIINNSLSRLSSLQKKFNKRKEIKHAKN